MKLQLIEGGAARKMPKSYGDVTPAQLVPVLDRYRAEDPAGYSSLVACICGVTFEALEDIVKAQKETGSGIHSTENTGRERGPNCKSKIRPLTEKP